MSASSADLAGAALPGSPQAAIGRGGGRSSLIRWISATISPVSWSPANSAYTGSAAFARAARSASPAVTMRPPPTRGPPAAALSSDGPASTSSRTSRAARRRMSAAAPESSSRAAVPITRVCTLADVVTLLAVAGRAGRPDARAKLDSAPAMAPLATAAWNPMPDQVDRCSAPGAERGPPDVGPRRTDRDCSEKSAGETRGSRKANTCRNSSGTIARPVTSAASRPASIRSPVLRRPRSRPGPPEDISMGALSGRSEATPSVSHARAGMIPMSSSPAATIRATSWSQPLFSGLSTWSAVHTGSMTSAPSDKLVHPPGERLHDRPGGKFPPRRRRYPAAG